MLEGIKLIAYEESKELFARQNCLLKEFSETGDYEVLIRIVLLQTLPPICDTGVALQIMKQNMFKSAVKWLGSCLKKRASISLS